ncbi:LuxR C-terminal-related transcriptional regulator [Chitinophaga pendula]|uniref:LuxR C-terminal-related transcriptional regulator n=1 Tax=Chitinophaga TaxID=79328 RepID=UPI000BB059AD|nr:MULTISPECIES: LuxR C-terminal-related transcriptional regulator [Chitinophaga]ASZ10666.1 hypothetical protein CK934_06570 [Chitinophaga sp. MD30]UCJ06358.1 LuxR C-terminal-related transcriptional regulator [Chitinophaga pendula]
MQTDSDMERHQSLNALIEQNEQLRTRIQRLEDILHHVPAMLYTSDNAQKTVNWCNQGMEEATGFSLEEMADMGMGFFREIMHPDDFELAAIAQQSFKDNKNLFGGVTRIRKRGQDDWRWLVGLAVPFTRDEYGGVREVICAFLDLSVAIDTNEQLAEAMREVLRRQNENLLNKLTAREKDVLELAVKGLNNKEIAQTLNLSRYTVETHRKNIRLKLKVRNTTELIALARKVGYQ